MEMITKSDKDPWVDIVKWIACMLVMSGHFFQSMVKSGIISGTALYQWFEHTIYLFHVSLFFLCSGYLYQRNSRINNLADWKENVVRKAVVLGVPYVTFSVITYALKELFQSFVNTGNEKGLLYKLLQEPLSPYWYLYILFFVFLVTPTFRSRKQAWAALGVAFIFFLFQQNEWIKSIYFLQGVFRREIEFVSGMLLCLYRDKIKFKIKWLLISFLLFPVSVWGYNKEIEGNLWIWYSLAAGTLGCLMVLETAFWLTRRISERMVLFSRENTLPVFLMHTIFAAGIRSILLRAGVKKAGIHIVLGIFCSIMFPIVVAQIMRRYRWMYFFIRPEIKKKERQK